MVKYPNYNDRELSNKIKVKLSTLTSIKRRLQEKDYFQVLTIPLLNKMGCELLSVIHTRFNPVIPLEERVKKTKSTIEVFEEIFYSVGEQEKGFSVSLSDNYANIARINDIRTETFGKIGLLEEESPEEVIFPFENSNIVRFFDFENVLKNIFQIENNNKSSNDWFHDVENIELTNKEGDVYCAIVENPDLTNQEIGDKVDLSRHTVSRIKKNFYKQGLLKRLVIPDLEKLGFEILAFYHFRFNPHTPPTKEEIEFLDSFSTLFFAWKKFEAVIISAYPTYQAYKEDKMSKIRILRENDVISYTPLVGKYRFERMITIKNFVFAPLVKKILKTRKE